MPCPRFVLPILLLTLVLPSVAGCGRGTPPNDPKLLARQLASSDPQQRIHAATVILNMETVPPEQLPTLMTMVQEDPDPLVRIAVADALTTLGEDGQEHLEFFIEAREKEPDNRVKAALERVVESINQSLEVE